MGKQQPPAMSAPPRKRRKKGRPSLLDIQKRTLRLQKLQQEEEEESKACQQQQRRPSTRRNPAPDDDDDSGDDDDRRRDKKLRLVVGLHDGSASKVPSPPTLICPNPADFLRNSRNSAPLRPTPRTDLRRRAPPEEILPAILGIERLRDYIYILLSSVPPLCRRDRGQRRLTTT
jgi:hypothetical protein